MFAIILSCSNAGIWKPAKYKVSHKLKIPFQHTLHANAKLNRRERSRINTNCSIGKALTIGVLEQLCCGCVKPNQFLGGMSFSFLGTIGYFEYWYRVLTECPAGLSSLSGTAAGDWTTAARSPEAHCPSLHSPLRPQSSSAILSHLTSLASASSVLKQGRWVRCCCQSLLAPSLCEMFL